MDLNDLLNEIETLEDFYNKGYVTLQQYFEIKNIIISSYQKEMKEGDKNCKYAEKENWKQEEIWEKN